MICSHRFCPYICQNIQSEALPPRVTYVDGRVQLHPNWILKDEAGLQGGE